MPHRWTPAAAAAGDDDAGHDDDDDDAAASRCRRRFLGVSGVAFYAAMHLAWQAGRSCVYLSLLVYNTLASASFRNLLTQSVT